jgi:Ca-activated chloride channel homolog
MLNLVMTPHRSYLRAGTPEEQKLFVMFKMIPELQVASQRGPTSFVLVVDTSGSMHDHLEGGGSKMDRVIQSAHTIVDDARLLGQDKLAVVQFNDDASTIIPLTSATDKSQLHSAVDSLRSYGGGTCMAKGIREASDVLRGESNDLAKRVILLTDGQTFDEAECRPAAGKLSEDNTPVVTLGVGLDYNHDLLVDIANITRGEPYHLDSASVLNTVMEEQVGASLKEVITNAVLKISAVKGVKLESLVKVYPSLADVNIESQPYSMGNIPAGDYSVFVAELSVGGMMRPLSTARLAQASISFSVPGQGSSGETSPQDLRVTFTNDEGLTAQVDDEVLGYVQQKNVDRMVQEAVRLATVNPGQARQTLHAAVNLTQRVGNAGATRMLQTAMDEIDAKGTLSAGTVKTIRAGSRTKTVKTGMSSSGGGLLSDEEIRKLTGA